MPRIISDSKKNKTLEEYKSNSKYKNIFFSKETIIYVLVMLCDVFIVIYCACKNRVQYVKLLNNDIFVGNTKDILFGKNYVNVIITCFFYVYLLAVRKVFLHKNITKKILICLFCLLVLINLILFAIFTKRVY